MSGATPTPMDDADLDTQIADAERTVIHTDRQFLHSTREFATAMRGRAGNALLISAAVASALLAALTVHRLSSHRHRRAARPRFHGRTAPVTASASPRSRSAGFVGEAVGTALRAGVAPRPGGILSMLAATLLSTLLRRRRGRYR